MQNKNGDWEARWTAQARTAPARADNTPAAMAFEGGHIRLYEKLAKAEGSALCQPQKRSGFKGSYSDVRYLGLFPLPVHADEGIKPQLTFSPSVRT